MAQQQRRVVKNKVSKREQERMEARKASERASFSSIAMRVFIVIILATMVIGAAITIVAY